MSKLNKAFKAELEKMQAKALGVMFNSPVEKYFKI